MAGKPKKAKTAKKKENSADSEEGKSKGLFDHVKEIQTNQNPNYFDTLSDGDKKSWSNFMILKALSMDKDFVDYSADFFRYIELIPPEAMYKLLIGVVNPSRWGSKWVKGKPSKYPKDVVDFIAMYYEISGQQALDYVKLLFMMDGGKKAIRKWMGEYGHNDKEISSMFKDKGDV